jgi:hypothetical protein
MKKLTNNIKRVKTTIIGIFGIGGIEAIGQVMEEPPADDGIGFEKILQLIVAIITAVLQWLSEKRWKKNKK